MATRKLAGPSKAIVPPNGPKKKPGSEPTPVKTEAGCDCCEGQANGIVYCFDGAIQVFPFPTTEGSWTPVYTAGTGFTWANATPLLDPTRPGSVGDKKE